jgi:hypothetical protein
VTAARPLVSTVGDPGSGGARQSRHQAQPGTGAQSGTQAQPATDAPSHQDPPARALTTARRSGPTPSIADFYADLLQPLNERQRKGLIARLSVGYFEGWRPTRPEMAQLVAQELRRSNPRR